jgi:hypothetical protein
MDPTTAMPTCLRETIASGPEKDSQSGTVQPAFSKIFAGGVDLRDAPTVTVLPIGSAVTLIQGSFEAADQGWSGERLGQEANGSRLQCADADALLGKRRDKNKRRGVPMGAHMGQKVQTAHRSHLHIRNDA